MPCPRCCVRRATPPSHPAVVHELSQRDTDAFIFGERCTGLPRRRTSRAHSLPPNPRRTASPICPDLIYDRHTREDIRSLVGEVVITPGDKRGESHAILLGELMAILDLAAGRRRSPRPEVITNAL